MRNRHARHRSALALAAGFLLLPGSALADKLKPGELSGPTLAAWSEGIRTDAMKREVKLSALEVRVNVRGDIAETTVTATFSNPTGERLEGQFALNMPRGAVVTGYGLDIDGILIDGVLETKYKAAEAYQRRVSQRIDPGLAEVDYSDRFETRIYPIPARGARTIRLKMVSSFDAAEGYVLPMAMDGKVGKFAMQVEGDARLVSGPMPSAGSKLEAENIALTAPLKLAAKKREGVMLVSEHPGAERFFDIVAPGPRARAAPSAPLHIFWDRSVSRVDDDLKAEADLAADLAASRKQRFVKVTLFDSGAVETREIAVDRLEDELAKVRYRGGTSYNTLTTATVAPGSDCLMVSDGRVSIDDRRGFTLPCRIFTLSSGPESDRAWLSEISGRSGGSSVDLSSATPAAALARLEKPQAGLRMVTDASGARIDTARLPADGGELHIVGPMPDNGPVLVWVAGEATPRSFTPSPGGVPVFVGPGALWARHRLGVVAADWAPGDLAKMARRYNVATPQASFVVLESPNDYVQSDIEPPSTYPKALRQHYASLRQEADRAQAREREMRLSSLSSTWSEQKQWWGAKFTGLKQQDMAKITAAQERGEAFSLDAAPRPAPVTAPAASPRPPEAFLAQPERRAADTADIVVTGARVAVGAGASNASVELNVEEIEAGKTAGRAGSIEINDWQPDRPYLKRLEKAGKDWEAAIDKESAEQRALPLFWFDLAEWHWRAGRKAEARRAAEAALDLPARDNQTLAIVAARLLRYGAHDRAIWLLERLAERESDRPQPLRTLALALSERSKVAKTTALARADLEAAVDLHYKAARELFDVDAEGVEQVTLMEANAALGRLKAMGGSDKSLDERLEGVLDVDVRVVMEWNTPRTDLDLWITEPNGEKVGYSSPTSSWGGKLSGDVTNGYGPEEYLIRTAQKGVYEIRANTFASDRSNPNGPSSLTVRVIRNFGRPSQTEELLDIEMDGEDRDMRLLGKITIR